MPKACPTQVCKTCHHAYTGSYPRSARLSRRPCFTLSHPKAAPSQGEQALITTQERGSAVIPRLRGGEWLPRGHTAGTGSHLLGGAGSCSPSAPPHLCKLPLSQTLPLSSAPSGSRCPLISPSHRPLLAEHTAARLPRLPKKPGLLSWEAGERRAPQGKAISLPPPSIPQHLSYPIWRSWEGFGG